MLVSMSCMLVKDVCIAQFERSDCLEKILPVIVVAKPVESPPETLYTTVASTRRRNTHEPRIR